jgi:hypothetical protein
MTDSLIDRVRDDLHPDAARARSIVFTKEDGLPPSQLQLAIFDRRSLAGPSEQRLDMRIRIALGMQIMFLARHEFFQLGQNVPRYVRIKTLLHRNSRRGVRGCDETDPAPHAALSDKFLHPSGKIQHLMGALGRKVQRLHLLKLSESARYAVTNRMN